MPRINSRTKGSKNERDIAKWWKSWTGFEFTRTPSSGGLRWKKTDNISADIVCSDDKHSRRFPFSIECKSYKDINFEHVLLGNKKCKILEFWHQATHDAVRSHKIPILMMRYNGMPKEEYFFAVDKELGELITKDYEGKLMVIDTKEEDTTIFIFMATNIIGINYTYLYKEARKIIKKRY